MKLLKIFTVPMAAVAAMFDTVFAPPQIAFANGSPDHSMSFADNFAQRVSDTEARGRDENAIAALTGKHVEASTVVRDGSMINGTAVHTKAFETPSAIAQMEMTGAATASWMANGAGTYDAGEATHGGSAGSQGQHECCPNLSN